MLLCVCVCVCVCVYPTLKRKKHYSALNDNIYEMEIIMLNEIIQRKANTA
jgi:hypothetical protein